MRVVLILAVLLSIGAVFAYVVARRIVTARNVRLERRRHIAELEAENDELDRVLDRITPPGWEEAGDAALERERRRLR